MKNILGKVVVNNLDENPFVQDYGIIFEGPEVWGPIEKGLDMGLAHKGYIFDKKIIGKLFLESSRDEKTVVLFDEKDDRTAKLIKVLTEYVLYPVDSQEFKECYRTVKEINPKLKFIRVLTLEEMQEFCNDLVTTNKALKSRIIPLLDEFVTVKFKDIVNKEFRTYKLNELLHCGLTTGVLLDAGISGYDIIKVLYSEMMDKNPTMLTQRKKGYATKWFGEVKDKDDIDLEYVKLLLSYEDLLTPYWNTYRDTLIFFKIYLKDKEVSRLINRINNKAKKVKQVSMKSSFDIEKQNDPKFLKTLDLKRLLGIYIATLNNTFFKGFGKKSYKIRNGKVFIKDYTTHTTNDFLPSTALIIELCNRFKAISEKKPIILRSGIKTPLIMSDKKAIGGIYFGSAFKIPEGPVSMGIEWRENVDFDLSYRDNLRDTRMYYGNFRDFPDDYPIFFSGDIRNAGSEYFKFKETDISKEDGVFNVNIFSALLREREDGSRPSCKFYIEKNNEVIFETDYFEPEKRQFTFGRIINNEFILDINSISDAHTAAFSGEEAKAFEEIMSNMPRIYIDDLLDSIGVPYEYKEPEALEKDEEYFDVNKY